MYQFLLKVSTKMDEPSNHYGDRYRTNARLISVTVGAIRQSYG
ncbi:hypothetical protein BSM4216_0529 [Bacillus smithii]|nr:hypothetical protein BSM4216_0529 [Bacillus smithii]